MTLELRIRMPFWATRGMTVKVNGQRQSGESQPGSYRALARTWKTGDKVEVSLPMSLHAHSMPDDPALQAFLYGPVVLAGELGAEGCITGTMNAYPPPESVPGKNRAIVGSKSRMIFI